MNSKKKRSRAKKKRYIIPISIILILITIRLILPYVVKNYINETLNNIPGYSGHVNDIDLALWRGAYVIEGLVLQKTTAEKNIPLLDFKETDISIEWRALFKGKIVSEINMKSPTFNYVFENQQKESGKDANTEDWTKALTDIVPIDINHLSINNGTATFSQLSSNPDINLSLKNINLQATNLSNVVNQDKDLPSHIDAKAVSFGDGNVNLKADMNLLRQIPNMDVEFELKKSKATALNDLTRKYAGIDFSSGTFELYSEMAIADGYLKGYIKPMFINTKILDKKGGFFKDLWEGFVGIFKFILKNQGSDTLATKIPLQGDLNDVKSGLLPTIFNIFKNGWIDAFQGNTDEEIEYKEVKQESRKKSKEN